jgi:hypothetical protein
MTTLKTLKKTSFDMSRLVREVERMNTVGGKENDQRFWQPEVDKAGNATAIIRFLPAPASDGDDALPWVRIFRHAFKGPTGRWYIENSLTTLNQQDPVGDYNSKLWNSTQDDNSPARKQARDQKRKLTYISNIYVISDPKNPENEGKVFLYKYGKKIFDKISLLMHPEFEGETPINPFDFWNGANFKLRAKQVDGFRNYDASVFDAPSSLFDKDEKLEEIWKQEYSLKEFVGPDQFKSYDVLKQQLVAVLGFNPDQNSGKSYVEPKTSRKMMEDLETSSEDDDEELERFRRLADE